MTCRPLSAAQLRDKKLRYEGETGTPLRRKDIENLQVLGHLLPDESG